MTDSLCRERKLADSFIPCGVDPSQTDPLGVFSSVCAACSDLSVLVQLQQKFNG